MGRILRENRIIGIKRKTTTHTRIFRKSQLPIKQKEVKQIVDLHVSLFISKLLGTRNKDGSMGRRNSTDYHHQQ